MDIDYLLEVAWKDTGSNKYFFDPDDNLTGDVMSVECQRGRDFDSAVGRWEPGQLNALLRNDSNKYNSNNALSPLAGYLNSGRPVSLSAGLRESSLAAKFVAVDARYLTHADDAALSVGDIYWDMVVWIKTPDPSVGIYYISKWGTATHREYYLLASASKFVFTARNFADTGQTAVSANTFGVIPPNTWCMVHIYHDPTANLLGISVNAGVHDTTAITGVRDADATFMVGTYAGVSFMTGDIGPLAIWKPTGTNLTAAQLTWLYNGGYGRDFTELGVDGTDGQYLIRNSVGTMILQPWWQMDEVSGTRHDDRTIANLTESGGAVSSEAGLNTKIYRKLWAGGIDVIVSSVPTLGALHTATIKGIGPLSLFAVAKKLDLPVTTDLTGAWLLSIVLAFCGTVDFYSLGWDAGKTTAGPFYPANDATALELLRQMEDCEPGLVNEALSYRLDQQREFWTYKFLLDYTDRRHRLTSTRSLVSQAAFSDDPALVNAGTALSILGIEQLDPLSGIYNSVQVSVQPPDVAGAAAQLWYWQGLISISPGETKVITAKYPTDASGGDAAAYVNPWTTPVVGTHVNAGSYNPYLTVSDVVKSANEMRFSITTTRQIYTTFTFTIWGVPWAKASPMLIFAEDATSIAAYGLRAYPLPPEWLPDIADAQNFCDYIVSRYCLPHNRLQMTFVASRDEAHMSQALTGLIGDRIEIDADGASGLGIHEDFYIESIHHAIDMGKTRHIVTYELVSSSGEGAYFLVDSSLVWDPAGWPGIDPGAYPTTRLEY